MSEIKNNPLTEVNLICVYCNKINQFKDQGIYNLIKDPVFECQFCNELLIIEQIESFKINQVDPELLK